MLTVETTNDDDSHQINNTIKLTARGARQQEARMHRSC